MKAILRAFIIEDEREYFSFHSVIGAATFLRFVEIFFRCVQVVEERALEHPPVASILFQPVREKLEWAVSFAARDEAADLCA